MTEEGVGMTKKEAGMTKLCPAHETKELYVDKSVLRNMMRITTLSSVTMDSYAISTKKSSAR